MNKAGMIKYISNSLGLNYLNTMYNMNYNQVELLYLKIKLIDGKLNDLLKKDEK